MVSPPPRSYPLQTYLTLQLLSQARGASLPEREGLYREVVLLNLNTAESVARRYAHGRQPVAGWRNVAGTGLDRAVRTFNSQREHGFWLHAKLAITEEVRLCMHPHRVFRRAPRHLEGLALQILAVGPELAVVLGRSPRARDIAGRLQVDVDDVIEVLSTDGRVSRLDWSPPVGIEEPQATT
ncbi:MAG TPA: hypothetical protein VHG70_17370 [Nocardioidaceae bacterium]|nr:hypothetical protein [Nocardioidaceae bacterium]